MTLIPADLLAFSLIIYLVVRFNANKVPILRLFRATPQFHRENQSRDANYLTLLDSDLLESTWQFFDQAVAMDAASSLRDLISSQSASSLFAISRQRYAKSAPSEAQQT